ncbi:hypothetical protein Q8A73_002662 [Channa argus]|nr:hypothetical protein Q8A73_002662 [Channa argus]
MNLSWGFPTLPPHKRSTSQLLIPRATWNKEFLFTQLFDDTLPWTGPVASAGNAMPTRGLLALSDDQWPVPTRACSSPLTQEAWIPAKRRHRTTPAAANLVNQSIGPPSPLQMDNRFIILEELERPTSPAAAVPCDSLPCEIPHGSTSRGQRGRGLARPDVPLPPTLCLQRGIHMLLLGAPLHRTVLPNTATPAALSTNFSFSHTPRSSGRGGGTGLLINDTWKFSSTAPLSNLSSLEYHPVRITAPIAVMVIVIYRPPGQLGNFCDVLDMLLSHFPEDGTPLIVMGDLNIHPEKPQAADVFALVNTFDLNLVSTPPTHKAGNNLDLILTRNCT